MQTTQTMQTILAFDVGSSHLSYCYMETDGGETKQMLGWEVVDVHAYWDKGEFPKKATISDLARATTLALKHICEEKQWNPHVVLIEQQPVGMKSSVVNTTMKCLQHCIETFFVLKSQHIIIKCVSPGTKLGKEGRGLTYAQRKKQAVEVVKTILIQTSTSHPLQNKWLLLLGQSSKKDDLADSFLIAYNYKPPKAKKRKM